MTCLLGTGLYGETVSLYFDLLGCDNGFDTEVRIDNVQVSCVVPEPFSMAFLGSAFVGVVTYRLQRRRRGVQRG